MDTRIFVEPVLQRIEDLMSEAWSKEFGSDCPLCREEVIEFLERLVLCLQRIGLPPIKVQRWLVKHESGTELIKEFIKGCYYANAEYRQYYIDVFNKILNDWRKEIDLKTKETKYQAYIVSFFKNTKDILYCC